MGVGFGVNWGVGTVVTGVGVRVTAGADGFGKGFGDVLGAGTGFVETFGGVGVTNTGAGILLGFDVADGFTFAGVGLGVGVGFGGV